MSPPKAFTLIELIVVMTIIAMLSAFAMIDYGMSVKKARLQVATEEFMSMLQDGGVQAQSSPDGEAKCLALKVTVGDAPILGSYAWADGCAAPSISETERDLNWEKVAIKSISVETISVPISISDSLWFVFSPPDGDITVYKDGSVLGAQSVEVALSYNNSDEDVFKKTVQITPVTASFVIY